MCPPPFWKCPKGSSFFLRKTSLPSLVPSPCQKWNGKWRHLLLSKVWTYSLQCCPICIIIISFVRMSVLRQDNVFIIKFSLSPRKFFGAKLTETAKIIIIIIVVRNEILSVLGLNSGYTVEYSPSPSGVPSGFALGNSLGRRAIFDRISLLSS